MAYADKSTIGAEIQKVTYAMNRFNEDKELESCLVAVVYVVEISPKKYHVGWHYENSGVGIGSTIKYDDGTVSGLKATVVDIYVEDKIQQDIEMSTSKKDMLIVMMELKIAEGENDMIVWMQQNVIQLRHDLVKLRKMTKLEASDIYDDMIKNNIDISDAVGAA